MLSSPTPWTNSSMSPVIVILMLMVCNICTVLSSRASMTASEKEQLKLKTLEMFDHAYGAYKKYAFPADELMPLSCKGRYRGSEQDRGDIDEALGNFSLTLIDTLDTLVVLGRLDEFDEQVKYVAANVNFNTDAVVSVFETNIRVLGGLLGAHSVALTLQDSGKGMAWYNNELLVKAIDLADRLLAAFNTTTGIPYPKVNLRHGVNNPKSRVGHETDTCTACAGTMIMEFGALSRLSGKPIYEEKAHKAMDALWSYRSRHSDLVGTTINIHSGDWIRRDSGVGAGIDSYYEYCLKAYILLGDDSYLEKFNKHYAAIKKYVHQGYMLVDVMMHQPDRPIRAFVDALQAFWPGLQVLKGDLKPAIETHEMLYNVAKKYKFLPEAFTTNFDLHWAQHPLRPEFIESTYFLYEATKDPYYLVAGKHVLEALEEHARVPCGFAALKDLRTLAHEDKMDSFVLAETFKYLYLLFSEESEHVINVHDFIFTTEAHLLPLYLSMVPGTKQPNETVAKETPEMVSLEVSLEEHNSCPNERFPHNNLRSFAEMTRQAVNSKGKFVPPACNIGSNQKQQTVTERVTEKLIQSLRISSTRPRRLKAEQFSVTNQEHLKILKELGISMVNEANGKVQLVHQAALAATQQDAEEGILFMQEMIQLAKLRGDNPGDIKPRVVQLTSPPFNGETVFKAGSAQFGPDIAKNKLGISAELVEMMPFRACQIVENGDQIQNRIVLIERGNCMFIDKVRLAQQLGALGVIIVDHMEGTSFEVAQSFGMSGDSHSDDVIIPSVFLFRKEGDELRKLMQETEGKLEVRLAEKPVTTEELKKEEPSEFVTQHRDGESRKEVHIDSEGRKIITTTTEFIGPNNNGELKKHIQKTIQTCATPECDKDVSINVVVRQEDVTPEKTEKVLTEEGRPSGESVDPMKGFVTSFKGADLKTSEGLKEKITEKIQEESTTKICTSAGCFDSLKELQDMNDIAGGLLKQIEKLQSQLETAKVKNKDQMNILVVEEDSSPSDVTEDAGKILSSEGEQPSVMKNEEYSIPSDSTEAGKIKDIKREQPPAKENEQTVGDTSTLSAFDQKMIGTLLDKAKEEECRLYLKNRKPFVYAMGDDFNNRLAEDTKKKEEECAHYVKVTAEEKEKTTKTTSERTKSEL